MNGSLSIHLDFRSELPITSQIVEQIRHQVQSGELRPGDQLPTVRQLATELRVNFNTVARAYRLLDEAGLISTQRGRGTYIWHAPPPGAQDRIRQQNLEELASRFTGEALRRGYAEEEILQAVAGQLQASQQSQTITGESGEMNIER